MKIFELTSPLRFVKIELEKQTGLTLCPLENGHLFLNEEKIISNELTEKLVKMTGFRNAVAHDYEKLNYEIVYDVLQNRLKDIEEFIGRIAVL